MSNSPQLNTFSIRARIASCALLFGLSPIVVADLPFYTEVSAAAGIGAQIESNGMSADSRYLEQFKYADILNLLNLCLHELPNMGYEVSTESGDAVF